jgi:quercetin dioxygenase-like cupin family protein
MTENAIEVHRWTGKQAPTETEIRRVLTDEGLQPYRWSNAPEDVYSPHTHAFHKVLYVVRGSITFGLPDEGEQVTLRAGDRLELPRDTAHDALVGPEGVVCLEAHRK